MNELPPLHTADCPAAGPALEISPPSAIDGSAAQEELLVGLNDLYTALMYVLVEPDADHAYYIEHAEQRAEALLDMAREHAQAAAEDEPEAWLSPQERMFGLNRRREELRGACRVPKELVERCASLPYTVDEIDRGLELLGEHVCGTPNLAEVASAFHDQLFTEGMAAPSESGRWVLSEKGVALSDLLAAYADLAHA